MEEARNEINVRAEARNRKGGRRARRARDRGGGGRGRRSSRKGINVVAAGARGRMSGTQNAEGGAARAESRIWKRFGKQRDTPASGLGEQT